MRSDSITFDARTLSLEIKVARNVFQFPAWARLAKKMGNKIVQIGFGVLVADTFALRRVEDRR